ncbi:MAG: hypothetical protein JWM28_1580, partial [Chitinophagaceae bacterium]|nr:hypothetical protein [Chitinophagaceae bacterium]
MKKEIIFTALVISLLPLSEIFAQSPQAEIS